MYHKTKERSRSMETVSSETGDISILSPAPGPQNPCFPVKTGTKSGKYPSNQKIIIYF
jgi:hypothetical protein